MKHLVLLLLLALLPIKQENPAEATYKVQSIYIYQFTKYIQWPASASQGDFLIGVIGETGIDAELSRMAQLKTVAGRRILVRKYATLSQVPASCHILYLPASCQGWLGGLIELTRGRATLLITESAGATKYGSLINFVSDATGKPRFEMNLSAFERRRLKFDAKLKSVAIAF